MKIELVFLKSMLSMVVAGYRLTVKFTCTHYTTLTQCLKLCDDNETEGFETLSERR